HVLSSRSAILFTARVPLDLFTLSLHDALPILITGLLNSVLGGDLLGGLLTGDGLVDIPLLEELLGETGLLGGLLDGLLGENGLRSEEHTSELQSRENLVCRLLLEKKKLNYKKS